MFPMLAAPSVHIIKNNLKQTSGVHVNYWKISNYVVMYLKIADTHTHTWNDQHKRILISCMVCWSKGQQQRIDNCSGVTHWKSSQGWEIRGSSSEEAKVAPVYIILVEHSPRMESVKQDEFWVSVRNCQENKSLMTSVFSKTWNCSWNVLSHPFRYIRWEWVHFRLFITTGFLFVYMSLWKNMFLPHAAYSYDYKQFELMRTLLM